MDIRTSSEYIEEEEEEVNIINDSTYISDEDEDDQEVEELKDIEPPIVSSWMGPGGKIVYGLIIISVYLEFLFDECQICFQSWTTTGDHQICCLPCGHIYGFSCIKKWLLQSSSLSSGGRNRKRKGKCPQCNTLCSIKGVIPLYAPHLCAAAHQKASSTRRFPFTEQGFIEFKEHQRSQQLDAKKLLADDSIKMVSVLNRQFDATNQRGILLREWDSLLTQAEELEEIGQPADALRSQADALREQIDALGRRADALGHRADALERRAGVLRRRIDAFEPSLKFFNLMYKEHHERMAQQKMNTESCAAAITCYEH